MKATAGSTHHCCLCVCVLFLLVWSEKCQSWRIRLLKLGGGDRVQTLTERKHTSGRSGSLSLFISRTSNITGVSRRILFSWLLVDWGPVSRALPAPADLCQSEHETRQSQEGPSQQDDAGQDEGQQVHRGEVVRVSPGEEGEVPAEEESVHDGESQGSVAESGLQTHTQKSSQTLRWRNKTRELCSHYNNRQIQTGLDSKIRWSDLGLLRTRLHTSWASNTRLTYYSVSTHSRHGGACRRCAGLLWWRRSWAGGQSVGLTSRSTFLSDWQPQALRSDWNNDRQ